MRRKISLIILTFAIVLAVIIPSSKVYAADKKVNSVETSQAGGKLTVSGDVEEGMLAVAIQILDTNENLITLTTGAVDENNKFNVDVEIPEGNYIIRVADYDKGAVFTVSSPDDEKTEQQSNPTSENDSTTPTSNETKKEETKTTEKKNGANPSTGDTIIRFVTIFAIATIVLMFVKKASKKNTRVRKH